MMVRFTPFHLVDGSPWPLLSALGAFGVVGGLMSMMHQHLFGTLFMYVGLIFLLTILWWRDVDRESSLLGFHTKGVQKNMYSGMIWFIMSEVFFFIGFFWTFFHSGLNSVIDLGMEWPPFGVMVLNPYGVPLLNTAVLISSGITVTCSHYSLLISDFNSCAIWLANTIMLGVLFTGLQYMEYLESSFGMNDSVYGSIFFMATGFHGFHVIIGSIFLFISFLRILGGKLSPSRHVGFECAIWYWHFVDVVWIFLYACIYGWGSL
uniref:Cytochrome c oxidase subunit 3 n=7 Tax=Ciona TaxID=7718 RepID=Q8HIN3_CIOIN|nr:cytochrome c oxidase subunit III [Ciona robusta]CAD56918.1 cytochrome oxidase subunit III [Ciona robusta]SBU37555.1 cytochrome oxidase subunit III [Ciona robusta]